MCNLGDKMDTGYMIIIIIALIVYSIIYYRYVKKYGIIKGIMVATLFLGVSIILIIHFGTIGLLISLIINKLLLR